MKYILDCHSHTFASGHAYSTIAEYAKEASEKGFELIANTDHGSKLPGGAHIYHFQNLKKMPKYIHGVRVLQGAEANILDFNGNLDLEDFVLKELDIVIASLHPPCYRVGTMDENTKAVITAMKNDYVNIIGHPDDSRVPLDYESLVNAAKEYHVLLELNNSSLAPNSFRVNSYENYQIMLDLCKKEYVSIIISSDSHYHASIGNFKNAEKLLNEFDFPQELIINTSIDKLQEWLHKTI